MNLNCAVLRCEIVIIPEMTARRLMTLAARCFLTVLPAAAVPERTTAAALLRRPAAYATASAG
jgi:hypothetical protein